MGYLSSIRDVTFEKDYVNTITFYAFLIDSFDTSTVNVNLLKIIQLSKLFSDQF